MDKIGKYEIVEMVGRGAMGLVFKGYDRSIGRHVAIKVMTTSMEIDPDLRERFFREAQAAGTLQHPNVVTVFELGESQGQAFIAMEFLPGRDLEDIIEARESLTVVEKVDLIEQVCRGLAYAHERGVIHRDIKPANIRVTDSGQVKLMDFGVAHLTSSELTATGSLMGTPYYMAPEVVDGKTIDLRTDIFSIGATFYELLSFNRPFQGEDLHAVFHKILHHDPPPLRKLGLDVSPVVQRVLDRSLAKRPAERYPNVNQLLGDLAKYWETVPSPKEAREEAANTLARTASKPPMAARRRKSNRILTLAATLVTALAGAGLVWHFVSSRGAMQTAAEETEPPTIVRDEPRPTPPALETPIAEPTGEPEPEAEALPVEPEPTPAAAAAARDDGARRAEEAAARRTAAARASYWALRDSVADSRGRAEAVSAASLEPDAFGGAASALAVAEAAARAGNYQRGMRDLRRARSGFAAARRSAIATWTARIDSARDAADEAKRTADTSSPSYREAEGLVQRATAAQQRGDYAEALQLLEQASASYDRAVPALPAAEPEPAPTAEEIANATLTELRRAIEGEDLTAVRRIWVSLSDQHARGLQGFFDIARDLKVSHEIQSLHGNADRLELSVRTTYDYVEVDTGRRRSPSVDQRMVLAPRGGRWVIVESKE